MIIFLDFKIFGNGGGLSQPFFPGKFYWLVDQRTKTGAMYTYSPGFGSQLTSIQWTHPNAGERREFNGIQFRPFNSRRRWGRVMVNWSTTITNHDDLTRLEQLISRC